MAFNDLIKSSSDRLKSPFLSSFTFSWIALNWKSLLVALNGKDDVYTKIACIESEYLDKYSSIWYPLFVALFYTLAFPYITTFFHWATGKARIWSVKLKNSRKLAESEELEKIAIMENNISQLKAETSDIQNLNERVSELEEINETKEAKILTLEKQKDLITKKFDKFKIENNEVLTLSKNFAKWIKPYKGNRTYLQDYFDINKATSGKNFLEEIGPKIEKEYSFDLRKNSSYNTVFAHFRNLGLLKIINQSQAVMAVTFTEVGREVWEINKFDRQMNLES